MNKLIVIEHTPSKDNLRPLRHRSGVELRFDNLDNYLEYTRAKRAAKNADNLLGLMIMLGVITGAGWIVADIIKRCM